MSNVEWSEAQWKARERFALASDCAKAAKAEPRVWAAYQKRAKRLHKRPRDLAISDYFKGKDLLSKKQSHSKRTGKKIEFEVPARSISLQCAASTPL